LGNTSPGNNQTIVKKKMSLLELAEYLQNVSEAIIGIVVNNREETAKKQMIFLVFLRI
jgi:hypothetical protein